MDDRPLCWCRRRHQTWRAQAACLWPRALWIAGNPPFPAACFAVLSCCPPGVTVTLWATLAEAREAKRRIDGGACGGRCQGRHDLERLACEPPAGPCRRPGPEDDS